MKKLLLEYLAELKGLPKFYYLNLKDYIHNVRCGFKSYRKKLGGKWYYQYEANGHNTIDGAAQYWAQELHPNAQLLKVEDYTTTSP